MTAYPFSSYDEAAQAYLARFDELLAPPPSPARYLVPGLATLSIDAVGRQASEIAALSTQMLTLARPLLASPDTVTRSGITLQFLTQAGAELYLAAELLKAVEQESGPRGMAWAGASPSLDIDALGSTVAVLHQVMNSPASDGIISPERRQLATDPHSVDQAKRDLRSGIQQDVSAITGRVRGLGSAIAFDLVMRTEWSVVAEGARLMGKDVASLLDSLAKGLGAGLALAVKGAIDAILSAYDKILELIGKDPDSLARKQIQDWLERMRRSQATDLFDQLIDKLYKTPEMQKEISRCIEKSNATLDCIYQTTLLSNDVATRFTVMTDKLAQMGKVLNTLKLAALPQLQTIVAGVQVSLLTFVVYAGYDYLGYKNPLLNGHVKFLDLGKGICEIVRENLAQ